MRKCFPRLIVPSSAAVKCRKFWLIAALYVRRKTRAAARIAGPVIILCASPGFASAQDATWSGASSNLWNNASNWTPGLPGATGIATFNPASPTSISTLGGVSVGTLQFNAPNYTFEALDSVSINGNGVNASLANAPTFNVIGSGFHSTPAINFNGGSSAGTAQIVLGQPVDTNNGFNAGFANFNGTSTADHATITVRDDSAASFFDTSTAGNATLIVNNNGFVGFFGASNGAQATVINNAGGEVNIANLTTPGTSFGSIAGAGTYNLGSKQLTVGSNGTSTTVSGVIEDHFPGSNLDQVGGSLVKVGTGTLTLSGANTYTGQTTISEGAINLTGSLLSPVSVEPSGTLGSTGTVFNTVTNAGTVAPGFELPATQFGTLTVNNYVGAGGTLALRTFLGTDGSPSDLLTINGGTATGSTSVRITNVGGPGAETTSNGILVVNAINGATTASNAFMLAPGELRAGAFDYRLFQGGLNGSNPGDWFLRSSFNGPGPPEPIGPSPPPSVLPPGFFPIIGPELATDGVVQPIARQMGLQTLGTLHQRIGDTLTLANTGGEGAGVARSDWARFFGQGIENRYDAFADPRASGWMGGFQGGVDLLRSSFLPGHRDVAGVYIAFANSDINVNGLVTNAAATNYVQTRTGTLGLNGYSAGGYWTHYGPTGWYLDLVLQGTYYNGNAITQFANLPINGSGFISSLEGGYPIPLPLGPRFVLEPQAQIIWQQVSFNQANDGLGPVGLGTTSGPTGRVGVRGMWTIDGSNGQVWQPYVRANLWRDWGAEATTLFGIDPVPLIEEATRLEFAGGVTALLGRGVSLYAQAGYQFALDNAFIRNGIQGDIGLRYVW